MSNAAVIDALYQAIRENRAPHALLITGMDGSDTDTVALSVAALITTGAADPARLPNCPDCTVIGAGKIGVDDIRELTRGLALRRHGARRAAVLLEAHRMTPAAQNALLKTLEEPPAQTTILLSGREEELLPTIRSRCTALRLGAEPVESIEQRLQALGAAPYLARHCAVLSGGAPLLAQALITSERQAFRQAALTQLSAVLTQAVPPFAAVTALLSMPVAPPDDSNRSAAEQKCRALAALLFDWRSVMRDALRLTAGLAPELMEDAAYVGALSRFTSGEIKGMIDLVLSAEAGIAVMSPEPALDDLVASLFELQRSAASRKE